MDIRSALAANGYGLAQEVTRPAPGRAPVQNDPGEAFSEAIRNFTETVRNGEQTAQAALTTGADPHSLVTALAQTELAVQTAVTVRDRVVEAYQEILRMPV
ncbi:flagellar hook-basal body complex protein FliE [Roseobacter sp. HKCCD9010]|uniref:flagellar hook-basal body complex protein FliE n=1 Tax=unclassified Roseobacter TaxID=196798 RepID=UPI00149221E6|nr:MULTISPECIES: flagellar hook-basal body complex protein FliE [unclassified Roseobacter]MBF9050989.1 flagellar hook-basal body complex protein FliE [Rhodobacterales bacterium HKCCD4356]NNV12758.1 flagellar hook-basal body complex protein FliE [Roseobacter sp. HKCCD7357]NNV16702.1 flagellar hook-basal body complex protein FliE [Roseobacter sp. HKCCD8768]NNV26666.1 flagellar hook-basal body complex protein FliE [Roseobacter sp. HKCCD8192]NNV30421.1 flagellar hook-basal body complex protein Fli